MKDEIESVNESFRNYFNKYQEENGVKITSDIDTSVVFVGAGISVLKKIMLESKIDYIGNIVVQRAIRTRTLKRIMVPEVLEWSSYFDALCAITNYNNLEMIIYDAITFLKEYLEVDFTQLVIKISSRDVDMLKAINNLNLNVMIELDLLPIEKYNHKYGLDNFGIYGRNFNIALRRENSELSDDIGNIVVIESPEKKYGVEFAVGSNAILMRKKNIFSSIEASSIADIITFDNLGKYKFADCVSVVSHLAYENVELIKNDRSKIYLYHKYLKALKEWSDKLNINDEELINIIEKYIVLEYQFYDEEKIDYNLKLIKLRRNKK